MRSLKSRALPASRTATNPSYRRQWALDKIELEEAWNLIAAAKRGELVREEPITVAIVDWGVKPDHQVFVRNRQTVFGHRVIPPEGSNFDDDDGHGTMLAGTVSAITSFDGGGRATVSLARLMAVKFIDVRTAPMSDNAAKAITFAVDHGAQIINASWNVGLNNPELRKAIEYAGTKGVLVVVAAGNNGGNNRHYLTFPASYNLENMISVMATDEDDYKADFSNYGKNVHIAAPGVNIVSTSAYLCPLSVPPSQSRNLGHRTYSGTSPAAAHVSGAAALLLSINRSWTPAEIREHLVSSADYVPSLERFGIGRLNLRCAVERAMRRDRVTDKHLLIRRTSYDVKWSAGPKYRMIELASRSKVNLISRNPG